MTRAEFKRENTATTAEITVEIVSESGICINVTCGHMDVDRDIETRAIELTPEELGVTMTVYGIPVELSKIQQQLIIKSLDGHAEEMLKAEWSEIYE